MLGTCAPFIVFLLFLKPVSLAAGQVVIDFEGLPDNTILMDQYQGVTFNNAIILESGVSLNEFQFPPYSGRNVASDNNGPMLLLFANAITSFGAYFTYAVPVTIDALDARNDVVASAISLFSSNEAVTGDAGSSPNEFIQVGFVQGISSVMITGDPLGDSFAMDNATFVTSTGESIPEPSSFSFCVLVLVMSVSQLRGVTAERRKRRKATRKCEGR